jgi:hypothetical protein
MFATCQLWGYFENQELVGMIAFRERWVDQLYVLRRRNTTVLALRCSQLRRANFQARSR